ncbi:protein kinase [Streptomyces sp. R302]|uniref:protein kinase domain-containing protein n=1 Tax=unclassified Streptomyces TaxID=2593676 RepID=UPI00145ECB20|nr:MULTISPECIES: protein kinase [unclassified Streptomyces]NML54476.1 protein kinase [Streptomyces sp. R301]NML81738.1 protein kinase [Streptomyces sp. R302]
MTLIAGRYRLLDALAEGAAGIVWRARDEALGREVAVKEVHAPPGTPEGAEPALYARVEREARAAEAISDPGVAEVYDVVVERGRPWIVMELVRGLSLAETLEADGPLPDREAARIALGVLAALRAARAAGVPYRELGPDRVLLANDGRVVVTGVATGTSAPGDAPDAPPPGPEEDAGSLGALLGGMVADPRSGPLAPVVKGLADRDADVRAGAVRELERVAGAGERPRGEATAEGRAPEHGPGLGPGWPEDREREGPGGVRGARTKERAGAEGRRGPRRGAVVAAGVVGLLVILAALVWQAVRAEDPGAGPGGGGASSTAPAVPGAAGTGAEVGGPAATPRS